ncbi:MAG: AAA family ATPase, partial [Candidatus Paceibacterota bacterium]
VFKFVEESSVPKTQFVKYSNNKYDILIKITNKQIHYRYKEATDSEFRKWCTDFDFPKKYRILDVRYSEIPLFVIFTIIEDRIGSGKRIKSQPISLDTILYEKYLWLAPIRAKAKRIYESYVTKFSPEGDHIPAIIRNLLTNTSKSEQSKILKILTEFGRDSNLFDEILVRNYSSSSSSPFEILIKYQDNTIKLPNVGYGVSQALPIIIEILSSKKTTFSIQQPEVHLHPKAQAAFGSFLFNSVIKDGNNFIIETHSDYTINRFRYNLNKKEKKGINAQIIFFERTKQGNKIKHLNIDTDGSFSSKVPDSYRDFYIDEELKMLEL